MGMTDLGFHFRGAFVPSPNLESWQRRLGRIRRTSSPRVFQDAVRLPRLRRRGGEGTDLGALTERRIPYFREVHGDGRSTDDHFLRFSRLGIVRGLPDDVRRFGIRSASCPRLGYRWKTDP